MPNIALIVLDTARADCISENITPTLHKLASDGIRYSNAFSSAPWTLPSHGSLFTGRYSATHGAHAGNKYLSEKNRTLAESFKNNGFETVGLSNNTWVCDGFGFSRGFDNFISNWQLIQSDTDFVDASKEYEGKSKWIEAIKKVSDGNPILNFINGIYATYLYRFTNDDGAERTNRRIKKWFNKKRTDDIPFFMFVNYLEPHLEYRPPRQVAENFLNDDISYSEAMDITQNAWKYITEQIELSSEDFRTLEQLYRAELSYLDGKINNLINIFKRENVWDETVLVIVGDHGENIGHHGLMDHQYCLYDTLLHVPLIIHGSELSTNGDVSQLVQLLDLVPTLLEVAGITDDRLLSQSQGQLLPPLADSPREYVFAEYMSPQPSIDSLKRRVGDPHNITGEYDKKLKSVRTSQYKYIESSEGDQELYDIIKDPWEEKNIVKNKTDISDNLSDRLESWRNSIPSFESEINIDMDSATKDRLERLGYI